MQSSGGDELGQALGWGGPVQGLAGAGVQFVGDVVEAGLVEAHGVKRQRTFTLSAKVYRELGESADYVHQTGFDQIQQEQTILQYARKHGQITRREAMTLCRVSEDQASRILRKLRSDNKLRMEGRGRSIRYVPE